MKKRTSVMEVVFGLIGVAAALVAVGAAFFFLRGEVIYEESADFSADQARFEFTLPYEEKGYRLFLVTKTRYNDSYSYRLRVRLLTPQGEVYEDEVNDMESIVDASHTRDTTRHVLFAFPSEPGTYELTVSLEERGGAVTFDEIEIEIRKRS